MYKINNVEFESPVDLMDAICDEYRWQWEDFYYDIEIVSAKERMRYMLWNNCLNM